jgi:putative phosphoribosyl transferase
MIFRDRQEAGMQLSAKLMEYKGKSDVIVMGLARGGVVVAYEIAKNLQLPLDVVVVRKIGAPGNEELALGAITASGEGIFNDHLITLLGVSSDYIKHQIEKEKALAKKRLELYFGKRPRREFKGKTIILVDDGIATGASMRVAIHSMKSEGAKKIVLAVPVAAPDSLRKIEKEVDQVVCLSSPAFFESVGGFYKTFDQTSDEEIIKILSIDMK